MNARERFLRTMHFEPVDRPFLLPQWTFPATIRRWHREGLPTDVHFNAYFGFDRYAHVPINLSPLTTEKEEVIEEDAETKVVRDPLGGVKKVWKYLDVGMPQWLEYPIKGRDDWERFKERLNPDSPADTPSTGTISSAPTATATIPWASRQAVTTAGFATGSGWSTWLSSTTTTPTWSTR